MELVRSILQRLEDRAPGDYQNFRAGAFEGVSNSVVMEHVALMVDGGLVTGTPVQTSGGSKIPNFYDIRLTWQGHDFLAAAMNDTVWNGAKKLAGEHFKSLSINTLSALLQFYMRSQIPGFAAF